MQMHKTAIPITTPLQFRYLRSRLLILNPPLLRTSQWVLPHLPKQVYLYWDLRITVHYGSTTRPYDPPLMTPGPFRYDLSLNFRELTSMLQLPPLQEPAREPSEHLPL